MCDSGIAARIKSIRLSRGETLAEFGNEFEPKAARSIVSRWENGKSVPNAKRLQRIAELGNMTVDELVSGGVQEKVKLCLQYCRDFWDSLQTGKKVHNPNKALFSKTDIDHLNNTVLIINKSSYPIETSNGTKAAKAGSKENLEAGLSLIEFTFPHLVTRLNGTDITNDQVFSLSVVAEIFEEIVNAYKATKSNLKLTAIVGLKRIIESLNDSTHFFLMNHKQEDKGANEDLATANEIISIINESIKKIDNI